MQNNFQSTGISPAGKIIIGGIAYADRIQIRLDEHERDGKIYDEYDHTSAMIREKARSIERRHIAKYRPKYNNQHT